MLYRDKIRESFATVKKGVRMISTRSLFFMAKKVATYVDFKVETKSYSRELFCHEKIRFSRQNSQVENRLCMSPHYVDKRSTIKKHFSGNKKEYFEGDIIKTKSVKEMIENRKRGTASNYKADIWPEKNGKHEIPYYISSRKPSSKFE
jgi:hypothetical protein